MKTIIRINSEQFQNSIEGLNKDFILYLIDKNIPLLKSFKTSLSFVLRGKKRCLLLEEIFSVNNISFDITEIINNNIKITIDMLKQSEDSENNFSRFKIYYDDTQSSFISSIIELFSFITAIKNKKNMVINENKSNEKNSKSSNSRKQKLSEIKANRESLKKASRKI